MDITSPIVNSPVESVSGQPGEPVIEPIIDMPKKSFIQKNGKLLVSSGVIVFLGLGILAWISLRPFSEEVVNVPSSGSDEKVSAQGERKEYEKKDLPPGIPGNFPRETEKEVIHNYLYEAVSGEKQSVRQFTVSKNALDSMVLYSDFFIQDGWQFSPALVVNTDERKVAGAYKGKDFLQISVTPIPDQKNVSMVEIVIIRKK